MAKKKAKKKTVKKKYKVKRKGKPLGRGKGVRSKFYIAAENILVDECVYISPVDGKLYAVKVQTNDDESASSTSVDSGVDVGADVGVPDIGDDSDANPGNDYSHETRVEPIEGQDAGQDEMTGESIDDEDTDEGYF